MTIDARRLIAEIEEEANRRRRSGELPPDFERELDVAFSRYAPVGAIEGDLDAILAKLDTSWIIIRAPVESSRRGVAQMKRVVGKAIDWDLRHLATQVGSVAYVLMRALHLLADRVAALDDSFGPVDWRDWVDVARLPHHALVPDGPWTEVIADAFRQVHGRALHAESGDGWLVKALQESGLDAYGVEPDEATAALAMDRGLDVRVDSARAHLQTLPVPSVEGVILSGCVDVAPPRSVLDLARLAASALVMGGRFAVISHSPHTWGVGRSRVFADLSAGHPLHPDTWDAVLTGLGFGQIEVHPGPACGAADVAVGYVITAVR